MRKTYHPIYNVTMGILMYFIAHARREPGLAIFHTIQKGIGKNSPINLLKARWHHRQQWVRQNFLHCEWNKPVSSGFSEREKVLPKSAHRHRCGIILLDNPPTPLFPVYFEFDLEQDGQKTTYNACADGVLQNGPVVVHNSLHHWW